MCKGNKNKIKRAILIIFFLYSLVVFGAEINNDQCTWEILDHNHFEKLCWTHQGNGEQYLIGLIPKKDLEEVPGPLFMRPVIVQLESVSGGVGHEPALKNCSLELSVGFPLTNKMCIKWDPQLKIYLISLQAGSSLDYVSSEIARVQERFLAGELHYWPQTKDQIEEAKTWPVGSIPVVIDENDHKYIPYSHGINYGRLRMISREEWERINEEGSLTREDIVVLQEAPLNFNARIAGAITCMPQSPLSHVNLICMQEAIPNAFVVDAWETLAHLEGELVELKVLKSHYTIRMATIDEAEHAWAARRPAPLTIRQPDGEFSEFPSLTEIAGTFHADRFGGKGAYLAHFLPCIPEQNRVPGFVIPFYYFDDFMHSNFMGKQMYADYLKTLFEEEEFRTNSVYRRKRLEAFQNTLRDQGEVPGGLKDQLASRIEEVFGSTRIKVRFRSSSNAEDALFFPGAGLYWSTSACAQDSLDGDKDGPCHCDPTEHRERTIGRALRKVWAGLWNFEAYEQRRWHGLLEDQVRMGILVTPAFLDEAANGVALTGSPTDPCSAVFYVTVQMGEESVVEPESGNIPELNLIQSGGGDTFSITRARTSSLVSAGEKVMNDAELRELAGVLKSLADSYTPPPPIPRELVRLDVEFKVTQDRKVLVKQVRPYIIPGTEKFIQQMYSRPYPYPHQRLVNMASGTKDVFTELADRIVIHLRREEISLPGKPGEDRSPWIEYLEFASTGQRCYPSSEASVTNEINFLNWVDGWVSFTWQISQNITTPAGDDLELRVNNIRTRLELWNSEEVSLVSRHIIKGFRVGYPVVEFVPCSDITYPRYKLQISLSEGGELGFLIASPSPEATAEKAVLVEANGSLHGIDYIQDDPFTLAVGRGTDSARASYLAITGNPQIYALMARFVLGQAEPEVFLLDEQLQIVEELPLSKWSKTLFSNANNARFLRGDANSDGAVNMADVIHILRHLFSSQETCKCFDAADANDDGILNISDAVKLLSHLFVEPQLSVLCEFDATQDSLESCKYPWLFCNFLE